MSKLELVQRVESIRQKSGLSMKNFLEGSGVHYTSFSNWLNERYQPGNTAIAALKKIVATEGKSALEPATLIVKAIRCKCCGANIAYGHEQPKTFVNECDVCDSNNIEKLETRKLDVWVDSKGKIVEVL